MLYFSTFPPDPLQSACNHVMGSVWNLEHAVLSNTAWLTYCDKSAELTPTLLPFPTPQTCQTPTKQAHTVPTTGSLQ